MLAVRRAPSSRSSRCWSARSGPGSRPTTDADRGSSADQLKRLDGVATILAKTAARDTSLLAPAGRGRRESPTRPALEREMHRRGRHGAEEDEPSRSPTSRPAARTERRVVPQSVAAAPAGQPVPGPRLLRRPRPPRPGPGGWPAGSCSARCFRSFETAARRRPAWSCPSRAPSRLPPGLELMPHQARLIAVRGRGPPHLPAGRRARPRQDRPGAARRAGANAFPLLAVVPNVVKTNWAREAEMWTPNRHGHRDPRRRRRPSTASPTSWSSTTRSSTGTSAGWASSASAAMVVDEAHFIKNKKSQRSQNVLRALASGSAPARRGRC